MYHTLLTFVFKTDSFQEAIKKDGNYFYETIKPFYQLSFLNEKAKIKKFWQGFNKLNPDVFFIQEFSKSLLDEIKKSDQHYAVDPRDDSVVILNKNSFKNIQKFDEIIKKINIEQQKAFRWGESIAFIGADNYIFACIHLSSSEKLNKVQVKNLKDDLLVLRKSLPGYHLIVGGDINSFLVPEEEFTEVFSLFPIYAHQHTTCKRRSYAQAQFHKAEKDIK